MTNKGTKFNILPWLISSYCPPGYKASIHVCIAVRPAWCLSKFYTSLFIALDTCAFGMRCYKPLPQMFSNKTTVVTRSIFCCRYLDGSHCFDEICCAIGKSTLHAYYTTCILHVGICKCGPYHKNIGSQQLYKLQQMCVTYFFLCILSHYCSKLMQVLKEHDCMLCRSLVLNDLEQKIIIDIWSLSHMQVFLIKNLRIGLKILLIWLSAGSSRAIIFYKVNIAMHTGISSIILSPPPHPMKFFPNLSPQKNLFLKTIPPGYCMYL